MNDDASKRKKLRVGILFGGKSAEHEVSIQSARNVLDALDKTKFEPVLIGIDKQGGWHLNQESELLMSGENPKLFKLNKANGELTLLPGNVSGELVSRGQQTVGNLDVIFPILHGPMGEDGTVQGFLELANIPYVGPGVLGSAIGMDKDVMKRLLRDNGIPVADFVVIHQHDRKAFQAEKVIEAFGLPLFVKPANLGSSVGVSKAASAEEFTRAIDEAFRFDRKVLVEKAVVGDEVECAILGNEEPKASLPGRIMPQAEFYSYEAKYIDEKGAVLEIPAQLPDEMVARAQELAVRTFQVLECEGLARVDMFLTKDGELLVNEINTIPGFTKISMYPKLWEASGVSYTDLISELLRLAVERFEARRSLKTDYE